MIINHNISALNAYRQLTVNNTGMQKSLEKLSSGYRINRAGDDAAGLAISEKMRGQIRGLNQAQRNAQDGISLIQTAEGALNETHAILQRMRELVIQAGNDTNTDQDRKNIQDELGQLAAEINRISEQTQFNGKTLLNGSFSTDTCAINFQIGANGAQVVKLSISSMDISTIGSGISVSSTGLFNTSLLQVSSCYSVADISYDISILDGAIQNVSAQRSNLGALQNRLEHTINNLGTASENLTAAESRIRDVDMAKEMMEFTKNSILNQAATAMLAQANMLPQSVLKLLG